LFGQFLPPDSHPVILHPNSLATGQNLFCSLLLFCRREDIRDNKKDKAFLLVEIRIVYREIPNIASMHKWITTQIDSSLPDLFTTWSPSIIDLCHFKVTVLASLQWAHQTLSSFVFLIFPYSSCM
jgi:hypothetical protein